MKKQERETPKFSADFETTTDPEDCRVWAWGEAPVDDPFNVAFGNSLDEFMERIIARGNSIIYFHNLAFDGKFIISWLFKHGYKWTDDAKNKLKVFTTLVSAKGQFYSMEIVSERGTVEIRDSLKLYPMSVRNMAKAFDLPMSKGDIDYEAYRAPGHELTPEEIDYLTRDVSIVAQVLAIGFEQGLTKLTIGANCMADYTARIGGSKRFKKWFPVLDLSQDSFMRAAYRGGFTFVNPKYAGVDVYDGVSVDFNSMYPSMMIGKDYPVGEGKVFEGRYEADETYPLYFQALTCEFTLKKDRVPMIQLRGRGFYGEHEYVQQSLEPETLVLTSVDLALLFENYDVDVLSWNGGFKFQSRPGEELFGSYIHHWGEIKQKSKGAMRQLAKLYLNNLYGKFSTNPDVTPKIPYYESETGKVLWQLGESDMRDPIYLPVGAFCTAYARDTLIRAILANYDRFVYCDTDSMHLLGTEDPAGIPLHPTNLGAWGVEGTFKHARHLRAKCYIWDLNGKIGVTCAGMPDNIKATCTFENFQFGFTNRDENGEVKPGTGKLTPVTVNGGVVLVERSYVLKA